LGFHNNTSSSLIPLRLAGIGNTRTIESSEQQRNVGNTIVDITAPGALFSLALLYLKSNNDTIAARISIPNTIFGLEYIRPDIILLRTIAKNVILWDEIQPTQIWIDSQLAPILQNPSKFSTYSASTSSMLSQTRHAVLAASCFSLALRFAGDGDEQVRELLFKYIKYFYGLASGEKRKGERERKEICLNLLALSLGLTMAGSGDVESLAWLRKLCKRTGTEISYGSHMACNMALGFLFLGGGNFTLDKSEALSIACLLISCYPIFPQTTTDNRYHLQALRHLYVMAVRKKENGKGKEGEMEEKKEMRVISTKNNANEYVPSSFQCENDRGEVLHEIFTLVKRKDKYDCVEMTNLRLLLNYWEDDMEERIDARSFVKQEMEEYFSSHNLGSHLVEFVESGKYPKGKEEKFAAFLTYYDIPSRSILIDLNKRIMKEEPEEEEESNEWKKKLRIAKKHSQLYSLSNHEQLRQTPSETLLLLASTLFQ